MISCSCSFPVPPVQHQVIITTSFFTAGEMLGTYTLERNGIGTGSFVCPRKISILHLQSPKIFGKNPRFSYRQNHSKIIADGAPCASFNGPFTSVYSFLENAIFIPGSLRAELGKHDITRELMKEFLADAFIRTGGRVFFGYDTNERTCGKFRYPPGTLVAFFASKKFVKLPHLGYLNAGFKHMVTIVRNGSLTLARCAYS
eukprot:IDg13621t1